MNIVELYYIRHMHEKIPTLSHAHIKIYFTLLKKNQEYYHLSEIICAHQYKTKTGKIVKDLIKSNLLEKQGCLLKIKKIENLATLL